MHLQQWCRSLLSIGGDNLQFYPNFALFSTLRGWTSTTILFRCGNLVKIKRKMQIEHFFSPISGEDQKQNKKKVFLKNRTLFLPEFRWRPKKKVFSKNPTLFFPNLRSSAPIQIIGGDADVDHSQTIGGGYSQIIGGDISPHPPRVSAPRIRKARWRPDSVEESRTKSSANSRRLILQFPIVAHSSAWLHLSIQFM